MALRRRDPRTIVGQRPGDTQQGFQTEARTADFRASVLDRSVQQFGEELSRTGFQFGAMQAEARATEAARSTVFERSAVERNLVVDGKSYTVRDHNAAVMPELPDPQSVSIYDRKFHAAMVDRYVADTDSTIRNTLSSLAAQHIQDPARFAQVADAYIGELTEDQPDAVRGTVNDRAQRIATGLHNSLVNQKSSRDFAQARKSSRTTLANQAADISAAFQSGVTGTVGVVQPDGTIQQVPNRDMQMQYAELVDGFNRHAELYLNGDKAWVAAQIAQVHNQIALAQVGLAMPDPKNKTAEQYALELTMMTRDIESGNFRVELPTMEDGAATFTSTSIDTFTTPEERLEFSRLLSALGGDHLKRIQLIEQIEEDARQQALDASLMGYTSAAVAGTLDPKQEADIILDSADPEMAPQLMRGLFAAASLQDNLEGRAVEYEVNSQLVENERLKYEKLVETTKTTASILDPELTATLNDPWFLRSAAGRRQAITLYRRGTAELERLVNASASARDKTRAVISILDGSVTRAATKTETVLVNDLAQQQLVQDKTLPPDQELTTEWLAQNPNVARDLAVTYRHAPPEVLTSHVKQLVMSGDTSGWTLAHELHQTMKGGSATYRLFNSSAAYLGPKTAAIMRYLDHQQRNGFNVSDTFVVENVQRLQAGEDLYKPLQDMTPENRNKLMTDIDQRVSEQSRSGGFFGFFQDRVAIPQELRALVITRSAELVAPTIEVGSLSSSEIDDVVGAALNDAMQRGGWELTKIVNPTRGGDRQADRWMTQNGIERHFGVSEEVAAPLVQREIEAMQKANLIAPMQDLVLGTNVFLSPALQGPVGGTPVYYLSYADAASGGMIRTDYALNLSEILTPDAIRNQYRRNLVGRTVRRSELPGVAP